MSPSPKKHHAEAVIMLLFSTMFWGLSFPLFKSLSLLHAQLIPGISSWTSTLYTVAPRFLLATLMMCALSARSFWKITLSELHQGVLIGTLSATGMLLQVDGLHYTEASTSAFLTQFYAILIPVTMALWYRRDPGVRVWVSCVLVLAGVAILGRFDWHTLKFGRGEGETLLASVFFMGHIMCLGWRRYAANRAAKVTLVMCATHTLIFSGLTFATVPDTSMLLIPWTSLPWVGLILSLALFCTVIAFTLMNTWQPKISTTEAGLIYCVVPIFGSTMALVLPAILSSWAGIRYENETATWTLVVGGALITLANVLIQLRPPRTAVETPPTL